MTSFSTHAKDQLRKRFFEIWADQERGVFDRVELTDPSPDQLFDESIDVAARDGRPAKLHPVHGILFRYAKENGRVAVKTATPSGTDVDLDDLPRCPVCDVPMVAKYHDPCPFCSSEWGYES